jgi:hypothetical protein
MSSKLKSKYPVVIGPSVWVFDENCRSYRRDAQGRAYGGPIYRDQWVEKKVIGETPRNWLVGSEHNPIKIPKSGPHHKACFSLAEVEDLCWVNDHRQKIRDMLTEATADQLRSIATILNYSPL